jgi:hypothetical protein
MPRATESLGCRRNAIGIRLLRRDRCSGSLVRDTLLRAWRHPEAGEQGDDRLDDIASVEDSFEKVLDRGEVRAALRALPARQREVLIEVYFRERSVQEAAEFLGVRNGEHGRPAQRRELHNYVVDHPPCSSGSGNERVPMTIADPENPGSSVLVVLVGRA